MNQNEMLEKAKELETKCAEAEDFVEVKKRALKNAKAALDTAISDLRAFVKNAQTGQLELPFECVNVPPVIEDPWGLSLDELHLSASISDALKGAGLMTAGEVRDWVGNENRNSIKGLGPSKIEAIGNAVNEYANTEQALKDEAQRGKARRNVAELLEAMRNDTDKKLDYIGDADSVKNMLRTLRCAKGVSCDPVFEITIDELMDYCEKNQEYTLKIARRFFDCFDAETGKKILERNRLVNELEKQCQILKEENLDLLSDTRITTDPVEFLAAEEWTNDLAVNPEFEYAHPEIFTLQTALAETRCVPVGLKSYLEELYRVENPPMAEGSLAKAVADEENDESENVEADSDEEYDDEGAYEDDEEYAEV